MHGANECKYLFVGLLVQLYKFCLTRVSNFTIQQTLERTEMAVAAMTGRRQQTSCELTIAHATLFALSFDIAALT